MTAVQLTPAVRRTYVFVAIFLASALLLRFGLTTFQGSNDPDDPNVIIRWLRFFSYFTIQSNIVALLATLAVLKGADYSLPWPRALRLTSLMGISITCIVYVTILAGDDHDDGLAQLANLMLHYIGPPLVVLSWIAVGPFARLGLRDVGRALCWPAAWVFYTLMHGWATDWWPYGFIDVGDIGMSQVTLNLSAILVFALILAAIYIGLDRLRRPKDLRRRESAQRESPRSATR